MSTKKVDNRQRNWSFILYPESAHQNWSDLLDDLHIQWIRSPLHDQDLTDDGQPKKSHYHIALIFDGKKSYDQIEQITDMLSCPHPQYVQSLPGLVRYMAHLDNKDKHQYDVADIIGHGGADVSSYLKPTTTDKYALLREIVSFVRQKDIIEYSDLVEYAMIERPDDWFPLLADTSTVFINSYITSFRNKHYRDKRLIIDQQTGEMREQ